MFGQKGERKMNKKKLVSAILMVTMLTLWMVTMFPIGIQADERRFRGIKGFAREEHELYKQLDKIVNEWKSKILKVMKER